jgi:primosomal protein N' (replication factor Y)
VQDALAFLSEAKAQAPVNEHISLFDPTPAALTRKANVERALLLVQSPNRRVLQGFLQEWISRVYKMKANKLRWHLDVDPWEI